MTIFLRVYFVLVIQAWNLRDVSNNVSDHLDLEIGVRCAFVRRFVDVDRVNDRYFSVGHGASVRSHTEGSGPSIGGECIGREFACRCFVHREFKSANFRVWPIRTSTSKFLDEDVGSCPLLAGFGAVVSQEHWRFRR